MFETPEAKWHYSFSTLPGVPVFSSFMCQRHLGAYHHGELHLAQDEGLAIRGIQTYPQRTHVTTVAAGKKYI